MAGRLPCAALAAALSLLGGCYNSAADVQELARQYTVATGHVVVLDCAHGEWWYEFEAAGKRRRGLVADAAGCPERRAGEPVQVYYNPAMPEVHRAVPPQQAYEEERGFHVPLWLWFGLGALALPLSAWMALRRGAR